MRRSLSLILLIVAGIGAPASAATGSAGTTAGEFLKIGVGARYLAMGEAATAAADDANAIFWNPANLARLSRPSLSFMYGASVEPFQYHAAAYGQPARSLGSFGLAFQTLSVGSIDQTNDAAQNIGSFSPRDSAGTIGWGRTFFDSLSSPLPPIDAGLNVKFIQSKIIHSASTLAGDAGVSLRTAQFIYAAAVQNIGGALKFDQTSDPLPLTARLGLAYRVTPSWLLSVDASKPRGGAAVGAAGTEYVWPFGNGTALALRGGFNTRSHQVSGLEGLSAGMGFKLPLVRIDYAWTALGDLGQIHRVSMTIPFGRPNAVPEKAKPTVPEAAPVKKEQAPPPAPSKQDVSVSTALARPRDKILRRGDAIALTPELSGISTQKDDGVVFVVRSAFESGKSSLNSSSRSTLNELAKLFKLYPKNQVLIEGHTNALGNPEYNKILSLERALSVANYFIESLDFPSDRFKVKGVGAAHPIASNSTEQGRQANVRVEITILYDQPPSKP